MKRSSGLLAGLTAASLTLTALGGAAWAAEGDRLPLTVNGEATGITVEEQNGGYLVPVRRLAEYLGYTVEWHPEDGTVTLDSGSMHATLTLGVNSYQAVTSLEGMVGMTLFRGRRHLRPPGAVRGAHGQSGGGRHRGGRRRGADDPAARGRRAASEPVAGMRLPGGAGAGRRISRAPARAPRGVYACAVPGHPRLPGRGALHRRRRHPSLPGRPRRRGRERRLQRLSRHLERGGRRRVRHLQGSGRDGIARPLGAGRIQLLPLL